MNKVNRAGWEQTDQENKKSINKLSDYKPLLFVEKHEEYVTWDVMLERAEKHGVTLGINEATKILEIQEEIPDSWQGFNIIFPGTRFKTNTNQLQCPFIYYNKGEWILDYHWYLYDFHHSDIFVIVNIHYKNGKIDHH